MERARRPAAKMAAFPVKAPRGPWPHGGKPWGQTLSSGCQLLFEVIAKPRNTRNTRKGIRLLLCSFVYFVVHKEMESGEQQGRFNSDGSQRWLRYHSARRFAQDSRRDWQIAKIDLEMGFHPMPRTPVNRPRLARVWGLGQRPSLKSSCATRTLPAVGRRKASGAALVKPFLQTIGVPSALVRCMGCP